MNGPKNPLESPIKIGVSLAICLASAVAFGNLSQEPPNNTRALLGLVVLGAGLMTQGALWQTEIKAFLDWWLN
jgi:predicted acyltransferase